MYLSIVMDGLSGNSFAVYSDFYLNQMSMHSRPWLLGRKTACAEEHRTTNLSNFIFRTCPSAHGHGHSPGTTEKMLYVVQQDN